MRIFHIYADGKTVKEINFETYQANWNKPNWKGRKIILVRDNELNIQSHRHGVYLRRQQLEQILKECWGNRE